MQTTEEENINNAVAKTRQEIKQEVCDKIIKLLDEKKNTLWKIICGQSSDRANIKVISKSDVEKLLEEIKDKIQKGEEK